MTRSGAILVVAAGLVVTSAGNAPSRPWPPALVESPAVLTPEVSAGLERVFTTPTLRRRLHAGSARAPLEVYLAFLDTPEVTAAATRFLRLASTTCTFSTTTGMMVTTAKAHGGFLRSFNATASGA